MQDILCKPGIERIVLASMLIHPDKVIPLVKGVLKKGDFSEPNHQQTYQVLIEMYEERKPITKDLVKSYMKKNGHKQLVSIVSGLAVEPTIENEETIGGYLRELKEVVAFHDLVSLSKAIREDVETGKPILDIIKSTRSKVDSLSAEIVSKEFRYDKDLILDIMKDLNERIKNYDPKDPITGIKTGFEKLDNLLDGLKPGLYVFGSPPSEGKTSFSKQVADQVAKQKIPVIFVAYEQGREELIIKSFSRLSSIDSLYLERGSVSKEDQKKLEEAANKYEDKCAPYLVTIEGKDETKLDTIKAYGKRVMDDFHTDKCLLIIDYLQVIPHGGNFKDTRLKVDKLLTELRRLARELKCPIWAISSFPREVYKRERSSEKPKNDPDITAFKESGNIEYTADVAIVMYPDKEEPKKDEEYDPTIRKIRLGIVKSRNASRDHWISYDYKPAFHRFDEKKTGYIERGGISGGIK